MSHNESQRVITSHNEPRTIQNDPQKPTTTQNDLQTPTTSHNNPQRPTTTHTEPQRPPRESPSITVQVKFKLIEFLLYALCFIYNKIIINKLFLWVFIFIFQCTSAVICQIETLHVSQLLSTVWFNQNKDKL